MTDANGLSDTFLQEIGDLDVNLTEENEEEQIEEVSEVLEKKQTCAFMKLGNLNDRVLIHKKTNKNMNFCLRMLGTFQHLCSATLKRPRAEQQTTRGCSCTHLQV